MAAASGIGYRADIDGLRAVAVGSVLVFHTGVGILNGGFVGVDIFFVISGYLITSILAAELARDRFSIWGFYERRARRILPALAVMMAVTLAIGAVVMLPSDFRDLARAAAATSIFASNVYFWRTSSYFDGSADFKPLLHTWSLGVEEQFYIVFPLLLLLAFRLRGIRAARLLVLAGLVLSFWLSLRAIGRWPEATFYLAPTRGWELLLGAALALGLVPQVPGRLLREGLALAGMAMIAWCVLRYDERTVFPGMAALWPCLGAALVIHARGSLVGRVLSLPPLVFVGLISYSLYLWHWPVIVFARYEGFYSATLPQAALIVALSFAIAVLSWRFIETPFQTRALLPERQRMLRAATACVVAGLALGLGLGRPGGAEDAPGIVSEVDRVAARTSYGEGVCFFSVEVPLRPGDMERCLATRPDRENYLLIGDSFAAHLWPGLSAALDGVHLTQLTFGACPPLPSSRSLRASGCRRVTKAVADAIESDAFDVVLVAAHWNARDLRELRRTLRRMREHTDAIVLFGPPVEYRANLPEIIGNAAEPEREVVKYRVVPSDEDRALRVMARGLRVRYVSLLDLMCSPERSDCLIYDTAGAPIQWDHGHLTATGSVQLIERAVSQGRIPGAAPAG